MTKLENIVEYLMTLQQMQPFSLGLHTTSGEEVAKSICSTGLLVKGRPLEGTLKIRGDMSKLKPEDIDFFFPYTDVTVMVAIPASFGTERIDDNRGGNDCLCEFSKYVKYSQSPLFETDEPITWKVPPEFIIGYFDKGYNFHPNSKCKVFDIDGKFIEDVEKDHKERKPMMDLVESISK